MGHDKDVTVVIERVEQLNRERHRFVSEDESFPDEEGQSKHSEIGKRVVR